MRTTNTLPEWRNLLRWMAATGGVGLVTAVLTVLHIRDTAAGLIFLAMVVWVASRAGLYLSLYVAGLCALSFDFFFLQPIHTFVLAGPPEWAEMLSFLVSSVVVGRLAERARRLTKNAEQRREDVERLYMLSQEMMLQEESALLVRDTPQLIARCFGLDHVVLYLRETDQFYGTSEVADSARASLRMLTASQNTTLPGLDGFTARALMLGMKQIGAFAWKPDQLSREVTAAVGAHVAIALTRALAIETHTRLKAAREGERLRTALIDSLTHELRTPLTAIRAAATTLTHGQNLDDAVREDLVAIVDEESARLDKLIGEAIEMAQIDANVVQVRLTPQHVRTLIDHVLQESQAALARHRVVVEIEEPEIPVWFDSHLLGRVFRHLLENAARFSPTGSSIIVSARRTEGRLEFGVKDEGPGIDPVDMPFIFDKFYRGKKSAAAGKGTGMGLPIAKAILAAHGGQISASTRAGEGTEFCFWVPLVKREFAAGSVGKGTTE